MSLRDGRVYCLLALCSLWLIVVRLMFKYSNKYVTDKEYERLKRLEKVKKKDKPKKKPKKKIKRPKIEFKSYKEYLKSKIWKRKRARILKRSKGICELCHTRRAYQVHHKTYKRIFHEKDTDLIAVCGICHLDKHNLLTDDQLEDAVNKLMKKEGYN